MDQSSGAQVGATSKHNAVCVEDADGNIDPASMHYLIDGGTEGLNGQARVIAPYTTACYECTIEYSYACPR